MSTRNVKSLTQLQREEPFSRAVAEYRRLLENDPDNIESLLGLGGALMHLREYEDALQTMRAAVRVAPNNAEAYFGMGRAYILLKAEAQAEQCFRASLSVAPGEGKYHAALGVCLFRHQPEEALTHIEAAYRLDPESLGPHPKVALWHARLFAGAAPNLWLVFWAGFAFFFTLAGWQREVPTWVSNLVSAFGVRGSGAVIRLLLMSVPFIAAIVVQLRRRRFRRAAWAFVLWALWGLTVWSLPIW